MITAASRTGLTLLLALAWVLLWHWPTAREMFDIWWRSETYAHGLVVLPICAWLAWRARGRLSAQALQPQWWMIFPVLGGGLLWLLGGLASVAAAQHFALVLMLVSLFAGLLGKHLSRTLLFPLLFLFFAVPIGDFMVPTLMHYTAEFTVWALRLSGVPVYQEGLHFVVPSGRWSVIEACSGSRYLIASLMVGALYAYLNYRSLKRRLWFMLAAAIVPIIANWLRAYMIVMLGHLSDNRIAVGVDHLLYGWVFFGLVIFLLFWVGGRWQEADAVSDQAVSSPAGQGSGKAGSGALAVLLLGLAVLPFPSLLRALEAPVADFPVRLELPAAAAGWVLEGEEAAASFYRPAYAGARARAWQIYRAQDGRRPVALDVAWYYAQREGSEMLSWGNGPGPDAEAGVRLLHSGRSESASGLQWLEMQLRTPRGDVLLWYGYRADGRFSHRPSEMKLRLALERLLGLEDASAAIVLSTPLNESVASGRRRLDEFLTAHQAGIEAAIDAAVDSIP